MAFLTLAIFALVSWYIIACIVSAFNRLFPSRKWLLPLMVTITLSVAAGWAFNSTAAQKQCEKKHSATVCKHNIR